MPAGQLKINGKDAFTQWGVSLESSGLSSLMTPNGVKDYINDDVRLDNGSRYVPDNPKVKERQFTLTFNLIADDEETFFKRYYAFCAELEKGEIDIETEFQEDVVYHCLYVSCNQFTQFMRGIAQLSLKLIEPNPSYRTPRAFVVIIDDYGTIKQTQEVRVFDNTTLTFRSSDGLVYRWLVDGVDKGDSEVLKVSKGVRDMEVVAEYNNEQIAIFLKSFSGEADLETLQATLLGEYPDWGKIIVDNG